MSKIRVLIVDDSVVIRKILTDVLSADPDIEVAGTAANGRIGLKKIPQVNPDLITLDIEMPELNGLETLVELRKDYPRLPVIMFSTLTERGAEATLDALTAGASDYVTKPANVGKVSQAFDTLRSELLPKIKALVPKLTAPIAKTASIVKSDAPVAPRVPKIPDKERLRGRVDVVAIGVSTGGPNALADVLPLLPADLPVPVVITQHMPPVFTKNLANRLNTKSALEIAEGAPGDVLKPGSAYVAPGAFHMVFRRQGTDVLIDTNEEPPENSCRPAVDVMFRSLTDIYGSNVLAVVMTGMGYDGHLGSERVLECGGTIYAQDEATSVVWGMPGIIVSSGLADKVLPLDEIASAIVRRVQLGRNTERPLTAEEVSS